MTEGSITEVNPGSFNEFKKRLDGSGFTDEQIIRLHSDAIRKFREGRLGVGNSITSADPVEYNDPTHMDIVSEDR